MSEYQVFEFQKLTGVLSEDDRKILRKVSSRGTIHPTYFFNEYHFGDFKEKPENWMGDLFDVHLYAADWGTQRLLITVPEASVPAHPLFGPKKIKDDDRFVTCAMKAHKKKYTLIEWETHTTEELIPVFDPDVTTGKQDWLYFLCQLREEILQGDHRSLYLGWLTKLSWDLLSPSDVEPFLPAGLKTLTEAQKVLVKWLNIKPEVLEAAAEDSPDLTSLVQASIEGSKNLSVACRPVREIEDRLPYFEALAMDRARTLRLQQEKERIQMRDVRIQMIGLSLDEHLKSLATRFKEDGAKTNRYENLVRFAGEVKEAFDRAGQRERFDEMLQSSMESYWRKIKLLNLMKEEGLLKNLTPPQCAPSTIFKPKKK